MMRASDLRLLRSRVLVAVAPAPTPEPGALIDPEYFGESSVPCAGEVQRCGPLVRAVTVGDVVTFDPSGADWVELLSGPAVIVDESALTGMLTCADAQGEEGRHDGI